jgi:hypothetical protein
MAKPLRPIAAAHIVAATLTACQWMAPQQPQPLGARSSYSLRNEPHLAAVCVARNVDGYPSPYSAHIRAGTAPALVEVEVRGRERVALVELVADGDGSTANIRTTPVQPYGLDELVAAMLAGC